MEIYILRKKGKKKKEKERHRGKKVGGVGRGCGLASEPSRVTQAMIMINMNHVHIKKRFGIM